MTAMAVIVQLCRGHVEVSALSRITYSINSLGDRFSYS